MGSDLNIGGLTVDHTSKAVSYTPADAAIRIAGSSTGYLLFGTDANSPHGAWINTDVEAKPLILMGAGGNVGVGTSAPEAQLHISDGGVIDEPRANVALEISRTSAASDDVYLGIQSGNTGKAGIVFGDSDDDAQGYIEYDNDTNKLIFNTNKLTIDSTGLATFSNGIAFQSATTGTVVSSAFSLDSYEEGTFTATLTGSTGNPGTLETSVSNYTKIGDRVYFDIGFEGIDTTGYSGNIKLEGLPFANNGRRAALSVLSYNTAAWASGQLAAIIDATDDDVWLYSIHTGGVWQNATHAAGASRFLWITGSYKTDA